MKSPILSLSLALAALLGVAAMGYFQYDSQTRLSKLEGKIAELESKRPGAKKTDIPEQKPEGPLPSFQFTKTEHDFGKIKEGDVVEYSFEFVNTGQAPLKIESAKGSCGCTVPEYPKEEIPVGGKGAIKVQFNSKGRKGLQNKSVTINANTWPKISTLRIKSDVLAAETK